MIDLRSRRNSVCKNNIYCIKSLLEVGIFPICGLYKILICYDSKYSVIPTLFPEVFCTLDMQRPMKYGIS